MDSLAPHYYIEVSKDGHLDAVEINVELAGGANTGSKEDAAKALKHRVKSYIGISASIKVHDQGGIPRSEGKAKRVVDNR